MQLFSTGLIILNDDGTPVIDEATGSLLETYTNADVESFSRAWTGFDRTASRGNYEETDTGTAGNRLDPMKIVPEWRDPFPKSHLGGGFIGDGYMLCTELPDRPFLKSGATYRLLGGKGSPELMKDPSFFQSITANITRVELQPGSSLYDLLYNSGTFEPSVTLTADILCTPNTVECDVDTLRVVKVEGVFYEYVERPCVQMAFYNNGKQIQFRVKYKRGQMCANPDLTHAREACCRQERWSEAWSAIMASNATYLYEGERMKYSTAQDRCQDYERDLCVFRDVTIVPDDNYERKGYHWTNRDCGINVKVNSEGYIAIVHDVMSTFKDTIPYLIEEENTLNWFRVFWEGGTFPGDGADNTCANNGCKTMSDGSCLCKTNVVDNQVFASTVGVTKESVQSQLFLGTYGPPLGSSSTDLGNGVTVHHTGSIGMDTVFEIEDQGTTLYLKNVLSMVTLEGWEMTPQIYEAEQGTINNAPVSNDTSSATGGEFVYARSGNESTFIEWNIDVPATGSYMISLRYAVDTSPGPLSVRLLMPLRYPFLMIVSYSSLSLLYVRSLSTPRNSCAILRTPTPYYH